MNYGDANDELSPDEKDPRTAASFLGWFIIISWLVLAALAAYVYLDVKYQAQPPSVTPKASQQPRERGVGMTENDSSTLQSGRLDGP